MEIYTDASINGNKFGLGILFIDSNDNEKKYSFGLKIKDIRKELFDNKPTTDLKYIKISNDPNIGEGLSILRSLQILTTYKNEKCVLYTDSLNFFNQLNNLKKTRNKLHSVIINRCKRLTHKKNVDVRWIKAHVGVYGNEIADKLAKAARRKISDDMFLVKITQKIKENRQLNIREQLRYNNLTNNIKI